MRTHYNNLKVGHRATPEEIRKAYKRLAQKHHPDRNSDSAYSTKVMKIINEAYDVLSDPVKRAEHDADIAKYKQEKAKEAHFQQPKPNFKTERPPKPEKESDFSESFLWTKSPKPRAESETEPDFSAATVLAVTCFFIIFIFCVQESLDSQSRYATVESNDYYSQYSEPDPIDHLASDVSYDEYREERSYSPSFDCEQTTTPDEDLICSDEALSALDVQVAETYKKVLSLTKDQAALKANHRDWIKNEHQICSSKACLMKSYQRRLTELSSPDWLKKWSPSFDCNAANTPDESLICSDEALSALDVQMAEAYKRVLSLTSDREALKATQIDWIKNDRELCSSKYCLMNSYQKRLVALSNPAWTYVRVQKTQENSVDYVTEYQKRMNNVND